MGFSLEIKANIVYENKNFLKGNFPRNSQLRPQKKLRKKKKKKMEALTVKGTQIKRIETKNPLHKHKFQL